MAENMLENPISIIDLVNGLLVSACAKKASDIHIDPQAAGVLARFRLDGVLQQETVFPKSIQEEIISRIKILAGLQTDQHQAAQDGRFFINLGEDSVDVRVSVMPTYYGENAVMRLLKDQHGQQTLDSLGFSQKNKEKILRCLRRPYGMILVTGPTGSGKTTTLYTLVKMFEIPRTSIITIEDPIEYSMDGVSQVAVNSNAGLTFASALRSMLRQDPNVIMVGEIRDRETAGLAVNSALTGHLVLSTIHTNDAASTIARLIDLNVEPYLIASTVSVVVAQRLVRKICDACKKEVPITEGEMESLNEAAQVHAFNGTTALYKGAGCGACNNTGYRGRVCINEVLVVDDAVRGAIYGKAPVGQIRQEAKNRGMVPLLEDGFLKVAAGTTTIEEILKILHE